MFSKRRNAILAWWHCIDNKSFLAVLFLIIIGLILLSTTSPAIAKRINVDSFYIIKRQLIYSSISIVAMFFFSYISEKNAKNISVIMFFITLILLIVVLLLGEQIKGSKRWLNIFNISIQPSELIKPFYAAFIAITLVNYRSYKGYLMCIIAHSIIVLLLFLQPDLGMTVLISIITGVQLFIAGLCIKVILLLLFLLSGIVYVASLFLPHVANRIELFFSTKKEINYQVQKSLESYLSGGIWGRGPGEGGIKYSLPDSHTDFIFAVAGEEFGVFLCLVILGIIAFIIARGFGNISKMNNLYHIYISIGIIMYIAIQSMFNIGVTLGVFPTKGMTLPFVSYGGSSMISMSIGMGLYLNATKNMRSSLRNVNSDNA